MNDLSGSPKLGVLINTQSGRNRSGTQALDGLLASRADIAVVRPAAPDATAASLASLAREGVNVLGVCGGDGTVQQVLNVILSPASPFAAVPVLAILPGGTTNMIAHDLNEGTRPAAVLEKVLKHLDDGTLPTRLASRPIIRLSGGDAVTPAYGLFFGAAGIYDATISNRGSVDRLGIRDGFGPGLRIVAILLKVATGRDPFPPTPIQITVDGQLYGDKPAIVVLASTMSRLSMGLRPFWGGGKGGIRVTLVFEASRSILRAVWLALRGRPHPLLTPANGYDSLNADRVELAFDGGCVLDGESFKASRTRPILLQNITDLAFIRG
jgi:diacylglycerol kinase family enzyme